jgi:hypothetical protein
MCVRTEAMRSEAGCDVLTIASNTARFDCDRGGIA